MDPRSEESKTACGQGRAHRIAKFADCCPIRCPNIFRTAGEISYLSEFIGGSARTRTWNQTVMNRPRALTSCCGGAGSPICLMPVLVRGFKPSVCVAVLLDGPTRSEKVCSSPCNHSTNMSRPRHPPRGGSCFRQLLRRGEIGREVANKAFACNRLPLHPGGASVRSMSDATAHPLKQSG
jgi:hypothetical protein